MGAGPRDLARRLLEHSREDGVALDATPLDRFLWGLGQVVRAVRLLATDAGLLRAAALPTLLTFLGSAALAAVLAVGREGRYLEGLFPIFVAVSSMPPTILWRLWVRVGMEARRAVGAAPGEEEHAGETFLALLAREGLKAARQAAIVGVGLLPVFVVVELVPLVGHGVTAALGAAWAWYWVVLDALEIPVELVPGRLGDGPPTWFERALGAAGSRSRWLLPLRWAGRLTGWLARPWRNEAHFTERHRWKIAGFAVATVVFLAIPVLGVFFRAVAVTAATLLVVRLDGDAAPVPGETQVATPGQAPAERAATAHDPPAA